MSSTTSLPQNATKLKAWAGHDTDVSFLKTEPWSLKENVKIFSRSTVGLENQKDKARDHYGLLYNLLWHLNRSFLPIFLLIFKAFNLFLKTIFSFDFCQASEVSKTAPTENLGQVVFGERIRPSPYKVRALLQTEHKPAWALILWSGGFQLSLIPYLSQT